MKTFLLLLAAGSGRRMGASQNKVFLKIGGKSAVQRCLETFACLVDGAMVVHRPEDAQEIAREIAPFAPAAFPFLKTAFGGETRQESVEKGFRALRGLGCAKDDLILIHDCARCLVSRELIRRLIDAASEKGAVIPGISATNTIKVTDGNQVVSTPDRASLSEIQTPQVCRAEWLEEALARAARDHFLGTDDASLLEHAGFPVFIEAGEKRNIKLTTMEDIQMAEIFLGIPHMPRVGHGYDVHRFAEGRRLILCGVEIPHPLGLLGHSDADVAAHALMDAMLGAAGLGDIGLHFPDTDQRYKGISSLLLLEQTRELIKDRGYEFGNGDITIIAQQPKLRPYIPQMIETLSRVLEIGPEALNIKATTTEKLGFEGRMEGISAHAVCLLKPVG